MWTGGYSIPPTTVLGTPREDIMFIEECVGTGEVAISDERALKVSADELARVVTDTYIGGMLTGKAGVTHFHVGDGKKRLEPLRELLEGYEIKAEWLYPTHVQRNKKLLLEAIALSRRGSHIDMDVVEQDLARWFKVLLDEDAPLDKVTISSDADSSTPDILSDQFRRLVRDEGYDLEKVLPIITSNTACILKMESKGRLAEGKDADVVVLDAKSLDICEVVAKGKRAVREGEPVLRPRFYENSYRSVSIVGDKYGVQGDTAE
jgi:beta-aspartyl-dipeptidase (metallo-type)